MASNKGKEIRVALWSRSVDAFENGKKVHDYRCNIGFGSKPDKGIYVVRRKERYHDSKKLKTRMEYVLFFARKSDGVSEKRAIHAKLSFPSSSRGLSWEVDTRGAGGAVGPVRDEGCVALKVADARDLYNWASVGTVVRVVDFEPSGPSVVYRG